MDSEGAISTKQELIEIKKLSAIILNSRILFSLHSVN